MINTIRIGGIGVDNKVVANVYSSFDYSQFKLMDKNRAIQFNNVQAITASIIEQDVWSSVIIVNEKGEIIDGQHRFIARRDLGLPIYYIIHEGAGEREMIILNVNKANWKPEDYLTYFVKAENEEYIKFQSLRNSYGIQISDLLTVIDSLTDKPIGETQMGLKFKAGRFAINNYNDVLKFISDLQLFKQSENYLSTYFIRAFLRFYNSDFYDSDFMAKRADLGYTKIQNNKRGITDEQCEFLAEIYKSKRDGMLVMYDKGTKSFYKIREKNKQ